MLDTATIIGILVGLGGIIIGNLMGGGHMSSLTQGTAAVIVFGGTLGATMMSNSLADLKNALGMMRSAFNQEDPTLIVKLAKDVISVAQIARKESILAVEAHLNTLTDPFMKNVFRYMIDGIEPETLRKIFETEIQISEKRSMQAAKVWSDAGGYAPTVGIIGAVLGLIHIMGNIADTTALGRGIAVAFVATIYGVGSANLFFIPLSNKIRRRLQAQSEVKRMVLEGAVGVAAGLNPYIIEEKMRAYTGAKSQV